MSKIISDSEFSELVQKMKDHYFGDTDVADLAEKITKEKYSGTGMTKEEIDTLIFQLIYTFMK